MTSNLSAFAFIPERAQATPALWNDIFSVLSSNIAAVGSSASLSSPSGNTVSISTNLDVVGGAHFQHLSIGSTPPSYITTAAVTIEVNSAFSDYLYLVDPSAQKSSYIIGSRAGGLADGLNIWDASAATMIASFSKQSIRFFQQVVGPVFDLGGALTGTYNAATFGTAADSKESRIQAAINQASIDGVTRVYVPQSMYPYSASSISFIYPVQMIREGGNAADYDVQAYGADPKGIKSSTSAMQAAHLTGQQVYYPSGIYKFSTISGIVSGGIVGDGPTKSILSSTDVGSANLITFTGNFANIANSQSVPLFRDFLLGTPTAVKTGGAGIQVAPPSGEASYLHFENVTINNVPIGIDFVAASLWKVIGCNLISYSSAGIKVANSNNPDSGDALILGCVFNNPFATGAGVLQKTSGGLKLFGNKMLGGAHGYLLAYDSATTNTANLVIIGNSMEIMNTYAIGLTRSASTATFTNVVISGNEFGSQQRAIGSDATNFLYTVDITDNVFNLNGGAGSISGVSLGNVTDLLVAGNVFRGNGGSSSGVTLSACTNGRVGPNYYSNLATNIGLTNSSTIEPWDANTGGAVTFFTNSTLSHTGSTVLGLQSMNAAADAKKWRLYSTAAGQFIVDAFNDAETIGSTAVQITRTAGTVSQIYLATPVVLGADGTSLAPPLAFNSEVSLGLYRSASSTLALSYGTLKVPVLSASSAFAGDGASANVAYAFASDVDTGMYRVGNNQLAFTAGGLDTLYIFQQQNFVASDSAANPGWSWNAERALGWYRSAASTIALSWGTVDLTGSGAMTSIASLKIKSGANNSCGTAVLGSNGSVNVANTYVKTGDLIFLTDQTPGGTLGDLEVGGIRNSSGFTIQSTSVTDTSTVGWLIIRPG